MPAIPIPTVVELRSGAFGALQRDDGGFLALVAPTVPLGEGVWRLEFQDPGVQEWTRVTSQSLYPQRDDGVVGLGDGEDTFMACRDSRTFRAVLCRWAPRAGESVPAESLASLLQSGEAQVRLSALGALHGAPGPTAPAAVRSLFDG